MTNPPKAPDSPPRVISTWFFAQEAAEGGAYAQVSGPAHGEEFRDVYRRCIAVFFASARRANPDAELRLYLNRPWARESTQVASKCAAILDALGVAQIVLEYSFRPPQSWTQKWRNQFFVFDVLTHLSDTTSSNALLLVLDSDIVWSGTSQTDALWDSLADLGFLGLPIPYAPDAEMNGMSRRTLTEVSSRLSGVQNDALLDYYGGEFIALRGDAAREVSRLSHEQWPLVIEDFREGRPVFGEEAHFYSHLVQELQLSRAGTLTPPIKRIWTQVMKYRNVAESDLALALWHLPAEKKYGIRRLYARLEPSGQWKTPRGRTWTTSTAAAVGIPRNTPLKIVMDVTRALASRWSAPR